MASPIPDPRLQVWGRPVATDADGIPTIERDADGVPFYPRLWRFMGAYDAVCY